MSTQLYNEIQKTAFKKVQVQKALSTWGNFSGFSEASLP